MKQFVIIVDDNAAIELEVLLLPYLLIALPTPVYNGVIGKQYIPTDNSWGICLETGEETYKTLQRLEKWSTYNRPWGLNGRTVTIISEPYIQKVECIGHPPKAQKFVNVLHKNNTYRVLWDERWLK